MKRFITGRQVAAGILTLVAIFGLCCVIGNHEDFTVFCCIKIIGIVLVYVPARIGRSMSEAGAWR